MHALRGGDDTSRPIIEYQVSPIDKTIYFYVNVQKDLWNDDIEIYEDKPTYEEIKKIYTNTVNLEPKINELLAQNFKRYELDLRLASNGAGVPLTYYYYILLRLPGSLMGSSDNNLLGYARIWELLQGTGLTTRINFDDGSILELKDNENPKITIPKKVLGTDNDLEMSVNLKGYDTNAVVA